MPAPSQARRLTERQFGDALANRRRATPALPGQQVRIAENLDEVDEADVRRKLREFITGAPGFDDLIGTDVEFDGDGLDLVDTGALKKVRVEGKISL